MMKKSVKNILGLLIFGIIGVTIYPLFVGNENMELFCESVPMDESEDILLARALESGYTNVEVRDQDQILIIDSRAMGRFICEVTLSDNKVIGTRYVLND